MICEYCTQNKDDCDCPLCDQCNEIILQRPLKVRVNQNNLCEIHFECLTNFQDDCKMAARIDK